MGVTKVTHGIVHFVRSYKALFDKQDKNVTNVV